MNNDERKLEELMSKMTFDDKPDHRHRDKLQQQLLAAFARRQWQQDRQSRQTPWGQDGIWRTIMQNKMRLAAVAAVVAITGVISVQFLTGTNAYAKVVEEIRNARTLVYTLITQSNTGNGETIKTDMAYKEPGNLRTTTIDGYVCIVDAVSGKMISIVPGSHYTLGNIKNMANTGGPGPFESIESMKKLPAKADQALDPKEIDGIVCKGYMVRQDDLTTTVWTDAKTGDLVQVEQKYASAPGMNRIIKNIKFDVDLDDSLFSLEPPAGLKTFGEMKDNPAEQSEQTFIDWLKFWAQSNTDETFPPMVAGSEIAKVIMDMAKQGKLKGEAWSKVDPSHMFNSLLFVAKLPQESNWRYAGNGVKVNTPDTPIFWYRPAGSQMYRVIYADLTVREMTEDQLPK
jgi:outer membrane lipoprotein-sorting protein